MRYDSQNARLGGGSGMNDAEEAARPPVFDFTHIEEQWGDPMDEFYRSVLPLFVEDAEAFRSTAAAALAAGAWNDLSRAAHTLKGAAANIGAARLARAAGELELSARADS